MINSVNKLFAYNYSLICSLFAWGFAQFLKIVITYFNEKKFNFRLLFSSGGMPSAHSAAVTALATSIGVEYGLNSPLFSIAAIIAAIVMYDSSGVRRSTGEQAKLLNKIIKILNLEQSNEAEEIKKIKKIDDSCNKSEALEDYEIKVLKEQLGHTTIEVLAGALIGILIVLIPF